MAIDIKKLTTEEQINDAIKQLEAHKETIKPKVITTKYYLHSNKETNYELGSEIGLKGKALEGFMYSLYEVEFELEVNRDTGKAFIRKVNDIALAGDCEA